MEAAVKYIQQDSSSKVSKASDAIMIQQARAVPERLETSASSGAVMQTGRRLWSGRKQKRTACERCRYAIKVLGQTPAASTFAIHLEEHWSYHRRRRYGKSCDAHSPSNEDGRWLCNGHNVVVQLWTQVIAVSEGSLHKWSGLESGRLRLAIPHRKICRPLVR